MDMLTANCTSFFSGSKLSNHNKVKDFIQIQVHKRFRCYTRAFASKKSARKSRKPEGKELKESVTLKPNKLPIDLDECDPNSPREGLVKENGNFVDLEIAASNSFPSRSSVLQACSVTSGLIAALGVIIRQVSHVASAEGLPIPDCSIEISFSYEMWHLGLVSGLVALVSSCRYLLLETWPDFAESSEAANQQVLTSLQPLDYVVVAFLPGISEELLFRGAMLPLSGMNLQSALIVAIVFGVLHLGSGRKYSFAVWATFVGFAYGYAAILSSSIIVPVASHALNNLVGAIIWRYSLNSPKQI